MGAACPAPTLWELTPTTEKGVYDLAPAIIADVVQGEHLTQTWPIRVLVLRISNLPQSSRTDPAVCHHMPKKARRRRRRAQAAERNEGHRLSFVQ